MTNMYTLQTSPTLSGEVGRAMEVFYDASDSFTSISLTKSKYVIWHQAHGQHTGSWTRGPRRRRLISEGQRLNPPAHQPSLRAWTCGCESKVSTPLGSSEWALEECASKKSSSKKRRSRTSWPCTKSVDCDHLLHLIRGRNCT
jgi:hypothetical protein